MALVFNSETGDQGVVFSSTWRLKARGQGGSASSTLNSITRINQLRSEHGTRNSELETCKCPYSWQGRTQTSRRGTFDLEPRNLIMIVNNIHSFGVSILNLIVPPSKLETWISMSNSLIPCFKTDLYT